MAKWFGFLIVFVVVGSLAMAVGFTWKQAILLAIFATYVERGLGMTVAKPTHTFEPYYVRIVPNWSRILTDFTAVKNDEDWPKFLAWFGRTWNDLPADWYSVLRNDNDGVLVYRGGELGIRTAIDWTYEVKKNELWRIPSERVSHEGFPDTMYFFVKQNLDVIQLGLSISMDWWQTFSSHCPVPLETNNEHMFGLVKIVLAQLPIREFDLYWNEVDYKMENVDRTWKSVRESRRKHGWEEIIKENLDFPSAWLPIGIKNKYFDVQHGSLR
jgi:hypothetical protein